MKDLKLALRQLTCVSVCQELCEFERQPSLAHEIQYVIGLAFLSMITLSTGTLRHQPTNASLFSYSLSLHFSYDSQIFGK